MLETLHYKEPHVCKLQESYFHKRLTLSTVVFLTYVNLAKRQIANTAMQKSKKRLKLAMRLK